MSEKGRKEVIWVAPASNHRILGFLVVGLAIFLGCCFVLLTAGADGSLAGIARAIPEPVRAPLLAAGALLSGGRTLLMASNLLRSRQVPLVSLWEEEIRVRSFGFGPTSQAALKKDVVAVRQAPIADHWSMKAVGVNFILDVYVDSSDSPMRVLGFSPLSGVAVARTIEAWMHDEEIEGGIVSTTQS